ESSSGFTAPATPTVAPSGLKRTPTTRRPTGTSPAETTRESHDEASTALDPIALSSQRPRRSRTNISGDIAANSSATVEAFNRIPREGLVLAHSARSPGLASLDADHSTQAKRISLPSTPADREIGRAHV